MKQGISSASFCGKEDIAGLNNTLRGNDGSWNGESLFGIVSLTKLQERIDWTSHGYRQE